MRISDFIGRSLIIKQSSILKREYQLFAENKLIGELNYPKLFSEKVECRIDNDFLEFKRPHIFSDQVIIKKQGYELPIATLNSNFLATKVEFMLPRGQKITMRFGLFKSLAQIYKGETELIVSLYNKISLKEKSEVVIEKRSEILDAYPWIILLAFYFAQLKRRNTGVSY